MKRMVLGISGASGSAYALSLAGHLLKAGHEVHCVETAAARLIMKDELGAEGILEALSKDKSISLENLKVHDNANFYAPLASGSFRFDAMAVCPCSMKTLGKLAGGIADNLLCRAAEVALKERRRLVIVPRETPLALTHLRNMATLVEAGAVMLPACPAFYQKKAQSVEDMVDFISARALAAMGAEHQLLEEWGTK